MTRFGIAFAVATLAAGCSPKTCETSSQCGSGEVCGAGATCQALSCSDLYFAVDPSNGTCRPLPACGNRDDVRGWTTCDDPCQSLGENGCIADPRCQPSYTTEPGNVCAGIDKQGGVAFTPAGNFVGNSGCGGDRVFAGCRSNALRVDPCAGLDESGCKSNPQCVGFQSGPCDCFSDAPCTCPPSGWECRVKGCNDYSSNAECSAHPECTLNPQFFGEDQAAPGFDAGVDQPFFGCFDKGAGSCFAMDEATCVRHPECHPVGAACYCPPGASCICGGGEFYFCEPDDGLSRCDSDRDCGGGQRCSNDEVCAPPIGGVGIGFGQPVPGSGPIPPDATTGAASLEAPSCAGICVQQGCAGYGENHCNADPSCQPVYLLNCSPYGGGFESATGFPCANGQAANPGVPGNTCSGCEPSFIRCEDRPTGSEVDPEISVMERDPAVVDSPAFSFPNVMAQLAGSRDPALFVDDWLKQLTVDLTVGDKQALARPLAAQFLAALPRLADGRLDLAHMGFQVTSLSNRIDLAKTGDCGEARITYALAGGVTDRRHRMTVIVELRQPDDGTHCQATALRWIALSKLKGQALTFGFVEIFGPLLNPAQVNQIRTNEFLVGDAMGAIDTRTGLPIPWELREFHLGADGALHLTPSKQAVDPGVAFGQEFSDWLQQNHDAVKAQQAIVPERFLAVTSSENGSRIGILQQNPDDFLVEQSLNKMACAGCHTTETNSAFAHVAERFKGTGKAQISDFLRRELPKRAQNLWRIGQGRLDQVARSAAIVH
jgi:hypothetical protein